MCGTKSGIIGKQAIPKAGMIGMAAIIVDQAGVCELRKRISRLIEPTVVAGVVAVLQDAVHPEVQVQPFGHLVFTFIEDRKPIVVFIDIAQVVLLVVEYQTRLVFVGHAANGDVVLLYQLIAQDMFAILLGIVVLPQLTQQIIHFRFGSLVLAQAIVGILNGRKGIVLVECIVAEGDTVVDGCLFGQIFVLVITGFCIDLLCGCHEKVIGIVQISFLIDGEVRLHIHTDATLFKWFLGGNYDDAGGCP